MSLPLLSTKFNLPAVGAKVVRRPRLLHSLDDCLQPKFTLVLVCGPAGYGKTTLVSQWLQTSPGVRADQVAWLRFAHRDIRLSGEGSWRLNLPFINTLLRQIEAKSLVR